MQGFHGVYWRFDLSRGTGERIPIDDAILERVLGGVGLGAWLLAREAPSGVDPLAPEAPLVFAFSPLVGTGLTTSAKFAVVAKSPLTGLLCDALASSHFAIAGKRMGVDAIVLVGACETPSELVDGRLRPTQSWGRSAEETARSLAPHGRVASIGVAGERLVRYATISADGRHAGRGGLGAVMGAKRLKAIVVGGEVDTPVADPRAVERLATRLRERAAGPATAKYRELGTVGNLLTFDRLGALPTRNFREASFAGAERLAGERWRGQRTHRRASCASCTIGCEHRFGFAAADSADEEGAGRGGSAATTRIEYESLFALGPLCGIDDPDLVLAAARRCDDLGLDTISTGATLAFAMECRERGLLPDGPSADRPEALLGWIDAIARREGAGDRLAEGTRHLARSLGGDALDFAPQVKGLELPGYEPRALQTMALGLAVGTRGADHNRSGAYEADFSDAVDRLHGDARSVRQAVASEDRAALLDSLVLCKFVRQAMGDLYVDGGALLEAVTGVAWPRAKLEGVARRIVDLRKAWNAREGWRPEDDGLPARFLEEPLPSGPTRGARLPAARLGEMIRGYNRARGWRDDGHLEPASLALLEAELDVALTEAEGPVDGDGAIDDAARTWASGGMAAR